MNYSSVMLLVKRQFKEHLKLYVISVVLLVLLLSFMFLLIHQWRDSFTGAVENGVFLIGLFLSGGLFTNTMFKEFSSKSEGIWLLSMPATSFEKVLAAVLLSSVVFLITFGCVFMLTDELYLILTGQDRSAFDIFRNGFHEFIFVYLIFNGLVLLGRVTFVKYSLLKTILLIIVGFILLNLFNNYSLEYMIPDLSVTSSMPLNGFQFRHAGENVQVLLPLATRAWLMPLLWGLLPLSLWGITWLKIKEKQI